jgi:SAM-dependent methyltransferase
MRPVEEHHLRGEILYGDDFTLDELDEWYEAEKSGYFTLSHLEHSAQGGQYEYDLVNFTCGFSRLKGRRFSRCLAIGCADGADVEPLAPQVDEFVAVEPAVEWWKSSIGGRPAKYVAPNPRGNLPLDDESVDIVTCFGVLHHIPNVSYVLSEIYRVLKTGGILLLREPISSMGDFRASRLGCTRYERGIPLSYFQGALTELGFKVEKLYPMMFAPLNSLCVRVFGRQVITTKVGVLLDRLISVVFIRNNKYWRTSVVDKFAPGSVFVVASKGTRVAK